MMYYQYLPPILSTIFRIDAYIYLRIIPSRIGAFGLPAIYFLYLLTLRCFPLAPSTSPLPLANGEDEKGPSVDNNKVDDQKHESTRSNDQEQESTRSNLWSILCFSLQTHDIKLKLATIFINTLLLVAVLDFTFTPFFDAAHDVGYTRVGAVYPNSVKIQVRNPANDTLVILYRETSHTGNNLEWKQGPKVRTEEQFDWVGTVLLTNLWPSTKYEYTVASLNDSSLPFPKAPIPFRTFPDHRLRSGRRFRFIASSCLSPNFPYRGRFNKDTIRGFDLLADYLEDSSTEPGSITVNETNTTATIASEKPSTDFLLLLGDFIYADVPVFIGDDKASYRRLYRRNYQSPSFRRVYEKLPIIHIYDDHEIINNYAGNSLDIGPYVNGSAAYDLYAGNANYDPIQAGQHYYTFRHGDVEFFVLDTRRFRSPVHNTEQDERTMLGEAQLTALHKWLSAANDTSSFKFIVSSVPFTSLWTWDGQIDSWAGYPKEKSALLEVLHSVPNVVIISGDRHEFAVINFNPPDPKHGHIVREISTSPLSMFYIPFFRTLKPQTAQTITQNVTVAENVTTEVKVPYEQRVAYLYKGNSKWSTFELDTRNSEKPILRLETVIDGKPSYHLEIVGAPSKLQSTRLGSLLATNFKDLFDKVGLKPARWF